MSTWVKASHALVLLGWAGACVYLALRIVACGSEEDRLERQRGGDLTRRREMSFKRSELRNELDWASRREVIATAVQRLGLELQPPRLLPPGAEDMALRRRTREER